MKLSQIILISALALVFGACNKHSWDGDENGHLPTKNLFEPHGHHSGDGHDEDHGKGHEKHEGEAHPEGESQSEPAH